MPIPDDQSVFLNIPYDKSYEKLFVAEISTIVALGRKPRATLEITETGQGRLNRIIGLLESCRVSVHDLSRVGMPVRFNMPFELGLGFALRQYQGDYKILVLEKEPYRLLRTLSDYSGRDPLIHEGKPKILISCILDALGTDSDDPTASEVYQIWRDVWRVGKELKQDHNREDIYYPTIFRELVAAAADLAVAEGLLAPT